MTKSHSSLGELLAASGIGTASALAGPADTEPDDSAYSHRETMDAWERFLNPKDRTPSGTAVRNVIGQSWQRSMKSGVNARGRGSTQIMSDSDLELLRVENEDLLGSARRTFLRITETLADTATMAIITDYRGVILDVGGDRKTIEDAHNIRLEIGAAWSEGNTGTNGIGTALATGRVVHVHAAEHFCEGVKAWACVGAPIRSPVDGSILGIVDFSGPHAIFQRHNVALAMVSANHIELALTEKIRTERMQLLEASLRKMPRVGAGDGIIIVDRFGRVIHYNDAAASNLRVLSAVGALAKGDRVMDLSGSASVANLHERLPEELKNHSVLPLALNGSVCGAMLVVGPQPRPRGSDKSASFQGSSSKPCSEIIGESPLLMEAIEKAERAAAGRMSILLEGETGVGKELFARLIHRMAFPRGKEPLVTFNCGAVSKELIGGELFGHSVGAFTGATREGRPGRFEVANGGSLSLDEIGELPLDLQPYMLRVLEEEAVYRLGESKARPINVRLIASTNRNLRKEVDEGRFRKDLYFRVSAVKITIPPLRERRDDVEHLLHHFNQSFAEKYGVTQLTFSSDAMDLLQRYGWPGNIRELRNLVESAMLMTSDRILRPSDLPDDILSETTTPPIAASVRSDINAISAPGISSDSSLGMNERRMIEHAVKDAQGNITIAAQRLGVSRSTIYRKLSQYRKLK